MNKTLKYILLFVVAIVLVSCNGVNKPKTPTEPVQQTTTDIAKSICETRE